MFLHYGIAAACLHYLCYFFVIFSYRSLSLLGLRYSVLAITLFHLFWCFQSCRRGSSVFAGKQGFITLRDLFRWAERYRLAEQTQEEHGWLQRLASDGTLSARAPRL